MNNNHSSGEFIESDINSDYTTRTIGLQNYNLKLQYTDETSNLIK